MGYAEKQITIDCSDLGDGCFITIRNPALMAQDDLTPRRVPLNADGTPKNEEDARRALREIMAKLVVAWRVWDVETDEELPLPSEDVAVMARVPAFVIQRIDREVGERVRPT